MPEVSNAAFSELQSVTGDLEAALRKAFDMEKINYFLLMMVDKQVHFHVIPRYSDKKTLGDVEFTDPGWPKHPNMQYFTKLTGDQFDSLMQYLKGCW